MRNFTGRALAAATSLVLLAACSQGEPAADGVDPSEHDAFFLWSGVRPPDYLAEADTVYMLWGELRADDPAHIVPLRRSIPRNPGPELWLVVRAERLDWEETAYGELLAQARRWQDAGNPVAGVQVDFDAATLKLGTYAAFLADLRRRLPPELQLSATGLMDWSAGASDDDLAALAGVLDEVVVQTYQDRATIDGYAAFLPSLARLAVPYRVGLIEGGAWDAPAGLAQDPEFRGYVVFLKDR